MEPMPLQDQTNNLRNGNSDVDSDHSDELRDQPTVRLRNKKTENENGAGGAHEAIMRGLGVLQESSMEPEFDEIRRLDNQLDHLNEYMNKVEQRIEEHHSKLQTQLEQQRQDRLKRRESFHQRLQSSQAEDEDFHSQVMDMLNRCQKQQQGQEPTNMYDGTMANGNDDLH